MREIISLPLLLLTLFLRKMLVKSIQTDYYFDVYPVLNSSVYLYFTYRSMQLIQLL